MKTIYEDYIDLQNKYPNSIIFYQLGDFYEILGEKAKIVAEVCDVTLCGRDCGLSERVLMCGIPYYCRDAYIEKLRNSGYSVIKTEYGRHHSF